MSKYERQTFTDEVVVVDNNEYINCIFIRCEFRYSGGPLEFEGNSFGNRQPTIRLLESASRTIRFLNSLGFVIDHPFGVDQIVLPVEPDDHSPEESPEPETGE